MKVEIFIGEVRWNEERKKMLKPTPEKSRRKHELIQSADTHDDEQAFNSCRLI